MTKIEIIEETIKFYSEDPSRRAVDADRKCKYLTYDGRKCAYGRCMTEEAVQDAAKVQASIKKLLHDRYDAYNIYREPSDSYIFDEPLQEKYHGHNIGFWEDIQNLHDEMAYWDSIGLSGDGEIQVRKLKERYSED